MKTEKMKVLLYLKKSSLDKTGKAPIMGRITIGRSIAQFSCKLSCNPDLWNSRESRMDGKSREAVEINGGWKIFCFPFNLPISRWLPKDSHLMLPM